MFLNISIACIVIIAFVAIFVSKVFEEAEELKQYKTVILVRLILFLPTIIPLVYLITQKLKGD